MSFHDSSKCTRERITTALLGAGLSAREAIDCAGWLCGLRADTLPHLDALGAGEAQHVLEWLDNAVSLPALAEQYRAVRKQEAETPTPEQLRLEPLIWLF